MSLGEYYSRKDFHNRRMREYGHDNRQFEITTYNRKSVCVYLHGYFKHRELTIKTIPIGQDKMIVYHPFYSCWTIGFNSYDGRGIVVKHPTRNFYSFFNIDFGTRGFPHTHNRLKTQSFFYKVMYDENKETYPTPQLRKAEVLETKVYDNFKEVLPHGYGMIRPIKSGFKQGGCDIVITRKKLRGTSFFIKGEHRHKLYPNELLKADCVIEVLSHTHYHSQNRFNHRFKNFMKWVIELTENDVIPVIAFVGKHRCYYVIMDKKIVKEVFYKKDGNPRSNYSPVKPILAYTMFRSKLADIIRVNGKNRYMPPLGHNEE